MHFRICLLLLSLLVPALQAAEDNTEAEPATILSAAEQEAAMAAEIAAAEAAGNTATAAPAAAAASEPLLTDENFVPSVQISEDLSVSFPVDI